MDERAKRLEVQYLHGKRGSICGGHKREGGSSYPGRSDGVSPDVGDTEHREVWPSRQKSDTGIVCAGQRPDQAGSSPAGAWVRGVISKGGGNASPAGVSQ